MKFYMYAMRLLLLSKHIKFESDPIVRFCSSIDKLHANERQMRKTIVGNGKIPI